MRKYFATISVILIVYLKSFATGQVADLIIIGNDTLLLFSNPLESYFNKGHQREFPDLKGCGSTACWRGYQAVWKIIKSKLYLVRIQSCHSNRICGETHPANLKTMFGDKYADGKVFADWVTDSLVVPHGKRLRYIHMGYASTFEYEKLIFVKHGGIEFIKDFHNIIPDPKRLSRYNDSIVYETIFGLVNQKIRWNNLEKNMDEDWWSETIDIVITKKGKTKIDKESIIIREYYREVKRILKNLRWQIVKRFNIPYKERVRFEFFFDYKNKRVTDEKNFAWRED